MHDERSCPQPAAARLSAAEQDARAERSVLHAVIEAYPEVFTERELAREIADDPDDFLECDTVERAVRTLAALGLLHRCRPLVVPSRAALRFDALEELTER